MSHIRFTENPAKKRIVAEYRVLLSESWHQNFGSSTKEPFSKLFRNPYLAERVPDAVMRKLFDRLTADGFDRLPGGDPERIDLRTLAEIPRETDRKKIGAYRVLSVQRGSFRKAVLYADLLDPTFSIARDIETNRMFIKAEKDLLSYANAYCVQVIKETQPMFKTKREDD